MLQDLKDLVYKLIDFYIKIIPVKKASTTNILLLVKTDEIGDYVLWRNFLPIYRSSEKFKKYRIIICGNKAWQNIAINYDMQFFDDSIWVDKNKFKKQILYRIRFLIAIKKLGANVVVNTIYSRSATIDDAIVKASNTKDTIGMVKNLNNVNSNFVNYDKNLYLQLIDTYKEPVFDYYRNFDFTAKLLNHNFKLPKFGFSTGNKITNYKAPYFIIFPGSGNELRQWNISNFAAIASFVNSTYKWDIIICGGPNDVSKAMLLEHSLNFKVINETGKKDLSSFIDLLHFSKGIVSIDTGAVHLAAAANCPVFGVFNGSQYKRFAPYPIDVAKNFFAIYPERVEVDINLGTNFNKYEYLTGIDYNEVSVEIVKNKMLSFYNSVS